MASYKTEELHDLYETASRLKPKYYDPLESKKNDCKYIQTNHVA